MPRALIFGIWHHLVDLYKICSNYSPGDKNGPTSSHMFYIGLYREQHEKIFLSETTRPIALIFGMEYHLGNLYQLSLNYSPWAKNGPASGVAGFT